MPENNDPSKVNRLREEVAYWRRDLSARIWMLTALYNSAAKEGDMGRAADIGGQLRPALAAYRDVESREWFQRCEACGEFVRDDEASVGGEDVFGHARCLAEDESTGSAEEPVETELPRRVKEAEAALAVEWPEQEGETSPIVEVRYNREDYNPEWYKWGKEEVAACKVETPDARAVAADALARKMFAGENASPFDAMPEHQRKNWINRAHIALDHAPAAAAPQNKDAGINALERIAALRGCWGDTEGAGNRMPYELRAALEIADKTLVIIQPDSAGTGKWRPTEEEIARALFEADEDLCDQSEAELRAKGNTLAADCLGGPRAKWDDPRNASLHDAFRFRARAVLKCFVPAPPAPGPLSEGPIAATPDMVASLRKFVDHYPCGINPCLDAAWNAARAALAKAEAAPDV